MMAVRNASITLINYSVIPAKAGIQSISRVRHSRRAQREPESGKSLYPDLRSGYFFYWVPAFAGTTHKRFLP